jgi:predicted 3-demethylubiquinone-9 3-methyltransferase (glyoxalase superfamily)
MKKITPFLWFDNNLKEITNYYLSIFPNAKVESNGTLSDTPSGDVEIATMEILGQEFNLMTAGPMFKFNEAVSFVISCEDQKEIDYYWEKLSTVPQAEQCGWCKDKYGLSWQVVPKSLNDLLSKGNQEQRARVTQAFLKMKKFNIQGLEDAFVAEKV